jgi:predicted RNA binding protein YcfA (HicA-like mRNA interferase family)
LNSVRRHFQEAISVRDHVVRRGTSVSDYDRDLKTMLRDAGCQFERQAAGSHELWYSPITRVHFTVPHKIRSRHTANGILKQAGLPKAF